MPVRPRDQRDHERICAAGDMARAQGRGAMDAALAQIAAGFDEAAIVNAFKLNVERSLRRGASHAAVQARYRARANMLAGHTLDGAIVVVERWWQDERKAFQIASALGRGNSLSLDILRELRLMLRLMRFAHMQAEFGAIVASVRDRPIPTALFSAAAE